MPQVSSALELSGCHQPTLPCPQDIELILDTAETEAPGLRDLARRFLGAQATHLGVPLDRAGVLARRAEGVPEVHIAGVADELVKHLVVQPDAFTTGAP